MLLWIWIQSCFCLILGSFILSEMSWFILLWASYLTILLLYYKRLSIQFIWIVFIDRYSFIVFIWNTCLLRMSLMIITITTNRSIFTTNLFLWIKLFCIWLDTRFNIRIIVIFFEIKKSIVVVAHRCLRESRFLLKIWLTW